MLCYFIKIEAQLPKNLTILCSQGKHEHNFLTDSGKSSDSGKVLMVCTSRISSSKLKRVKHMLFKKLLSLVGHTSQLV